jgi:hypothetical protein
MATNQRGVGLRFFDPLGNLPHGCDDSITLGKEHCDAFARLYAVRKVRQRKKPEQRSGRNRAEFFGAQPFP